MKQFISVIVLLLFFSTVSSAAQDEDVRTMALLPGGDHPGAPAAVVPGQQTVSDPAWAIRTGTKKGVFGRTLDEELFAGPDAAVLRSGFFEQMGGLLAEFREPSILAEPWEIAGLSRTKPLLIIPSGGLDGLGESEFFKAGLAEYARSGGIVICFAQKNGADFAALPADEGRKIEAAGWAEDSGPLFRASTVQALHPILSGMKTPTPVVETDGYLISYPKASSLLFSRQDGFPTLILYPYGNGWVVVTALFSDFSFGQGWIDAEEKALVRDILSWAKASAKIVPASPGDRMAFNLAIRGPEQADASAIKVMAFGQDRDRPASEQVIKLSLKPEQERSVPFSYNVPSDLQPGLYHLEYLLLDASGKALSSRAESAGSGFSIRRMTAVPPLIPRAKQPLSALSAALTVLPSLQQTGSRTTASLAITPGPGAIAGQNLFVRVAGQEKFFKLGRGKNALSFDIAPGDRKGPIPYFVYHSSGRVLHRGGISIMEGGSKGVSLDMASYLPGQTAKLLVSGLGSGELTVIGLGQMDSGIVKDNGAMEFTIPPGLPTGTYSLQWKFHGMDDSLRQGELPITVTGHVVSFQRVDLLKDFTGRTYKITASFRVHSTQPLPVKLKLWLREPGGSTLPLSETPLELVKGIREATVPVSFKPEQAGIGELIYGLYQTLPEGAGIPAEPIALASGRMAFDVGDAAVLDVSTARPLYYEPEGPVEISAIIFGKGRAAVEVFVDGKRIVKEKADLSGIHTVSAQAVGLAMGAHTLRAKATPERFESVRERDFAYGTQLPDLAVTLPPIAPGGVVMPVAIVVQNRGKKPSSSSRVALYEGDPSRGGKLINKADVPLLGPGKENRAVIDWPLHKKSGARTLYAVADPDNTVTESNKKNNIASVRVIVPDLILVVTPRKTGFASDENIPITVLAVNLTGNDFKKLAMSLTLAGPAGRVEASETTIITELLPGVEKRIEHTVALAFPQNGVYTAEARISGESVHAVGASPITILPTLALRGNLQNTPAAAMICNPFAVRYSIRNAGNVPLSSGSATIEIGKAGAERPLISRQQTMGDWGKAVAIDTAALEPGTYTVSLKAAAANRQHAITREFSLAEQPLTVSPPVEVKRSDGDLPRVLVWLGSEGPPVNRAVAGKIAAQAFDEQDVYYKIAGTVEDFTTQAASEEFNILIIYEPAEMLENRDWLRARLAQGYGVVIAGESDRAQAAAEAAGFTFGQPLAAGSRMMRVAEGPGLSLTGTIPISGKVLQPRKSGAKTAAFIDGTRQPAALFDHSAKGKVLVVPFSLTRSAIDAGSTMPYSLLLRTAALSAAPEQNGPGNASTAELTVSAPAGPAKAKVVTTLPKGSKALWMNRDGSVRENTITHELKATREPQRLIFLYQRTPQGGGKPVTEVFYECNGKYVSQGKVE